MSWVGSGRGVRELRAEREVLREAAACFATETTR
jgi:hypothetical protein